MRPNSLSCNSLPFGSCMWLPLSSCSFCCRHSSFLLPWVTPVLRFVLGCFVSYLAVQLDVLARMKNRRIPIVLRHNEDQRLWSIFVGTVVCSMSITWNCAQGASIPPGPLKRGFWINVLVQKKHSAERHFIYSSVFSASGRSQIRASVLELRGRHVCFKCMFWCSFLYSLLFSVHFSLVSICMSMLTDFIFLCLCTAASYYMWLTQPHKPDCGFGWPTPVISF